MNQHPVNEAPAHLVEQEDSSSERFSSSIQEDADLIAPEGQVEDLELSEWQHGSWPSSKNVTQ